jgi:glycosyltransferase involved in cell wall biosynthesis
MPRLLFVANDAAFFISHRLPLAQSARRRGYDVHIATPLSAAVEFIQQQGFPYHPLPLSRQGRNPWQEGKGVIALYTLYRRLKPELVHHVTLKPILYGGIAARLARVPGVVNAFTGLGYAFIASGWRGSLLRGGLKWPLQWALGHGNGCTIFQNHNDRSLFIQSGMVAEQAAVLIKGSGVDMAIYTPQPEPQGVPVVLCAARMLWDKGVGEFIEAARKLQAAGIAARFVLVGAPDPGNPTAVPIEVLERWQREGTVEWWGYQENMPEILSQANVVCLPSYREGLPKVLIEAAACGRAIVTTDVPGCREVVCHGRNGLLVAVRDSKCLAAALQTLIENPVKRQRMGREGRALAITDYSIDCVIEQTLKLYARLLEKESSLCSVS